MTEGGTQYKKRIQTNLHQHSKLERKKSVNKQLHKLNLFFLSESAFTSSHSAKHAHKQYNNKKKEHL
jgi:hypothetical protein